MNFDKLNYRNCSNSPFAIKPTGNPCEDDIYKLFHPSECGVVRTLIIKPEIATISVGFSITFKTFLVESGKETEIVSDVSYSTSDPNIALINISNGVCVGVAGGEVVVSAKYQDYNATAKLTVLPEDECANHKMNIGLAIDKSKSMSVPFIGQKTKLDVAKEIALEFINSLEFNNERMMITAFDSSVVTLSEFSNEKNKKKNAINSITYSNENTDIKVGIAPFIDYFNDKNNLYPTNTRFYIIITDGEDPYYVNRLYFLNTIKDAGVIIVIVGVKSHSCYFTFLKEAATYGYFVNAYNEETLTEAKKFVRNLKKYNCLNCAPEPPPVTPPPPEVDDCIYSKGCPTLVYRALNNWNVNPMDAVDLIGGNKTYYLYDIQPCNGLYLDMFASPSISNHNWIQSKQSFKWITDDIKYIKFRAAGNLRENRSDDTLKIIVFWNETETQEYEYRIPANQEFTQYVQEISPPPTATEGKMEIHVYADNNASLRYGILLDSVGVCNSSGNTIFYDDFDSENMEGWDYI